MNDTEIVAGDAVTNSTPEPVTNNMSHGIFITVGVMLIITLLFGCLVLTITKLRLSDNNNNNNNNHNNGRIAGIDEATLNSIPKHRYHAQEEEEEDVERGDKGCAICLGEYVDSLDVVRVMKDCGHMFHQECLDQWLKLHATCPICRISPLPTP